MNAISSLFKQTMLLTGQTFHFILFTYYLKENVLSSLVDNVRNVKEILKNPDMAMDIICKTCLFGDKFEEKLLNDTNAKQKSKLIFSGL